MKNETWDIKSNDDTLHGSAREKRWTAGESVWAIDETRIFQLHIRQLWNGGNDRRCPHDGGASDRLDNLKTLTRRFNRIWLIVFLLEDFQLESIDFGFVWNILFLIEFFESETFLIWNDFVCSHRLVTLDRFRTWNLRCSLFSEKSLCSRH